MYKDKFVVSIIHDGHSIKESGGRDSRQVAIPFESEYKIRLKNKNERSCTARITIDGAPVSNFGDVIVGAGATVDLERFITSSMSSGKKFKFVDLDHSDVDDPTKSENGIIRVEFRLAKQKNGIKITPSPPWYPPNTPFYEDNNGWQWQHTTYRYDSNTGDDNVGGTYNSSSSGLRPEPDKSVSSRMYSAFNCSKSIPIVDAVAEAGATVEGGYSGQSFDYAELDVESHATVLELRMVGIRTNTPRFSAKQYCTSCGHRIKRNDRYCGGCGRKV